jgi:hypothetical protein
VTVMMASVVLAAVLTVAPPVLVLERVEVALPNPDTARVTLVAQAASGLPSAGVVGQRLSLGAGVAIPLATSAQLTGDARTACVTFEVRLRDAPEAVLELDPAAVRVRWEALGADGRPLFAVAGILDAADRSRLVVAGEAVGDAYARLEDVKLTPGIGSLGVRALASLYNPFAFDLVIVRLEYHLAVGSQTLLAGKRPGVRLRAGQRSDVLLEQEVTLADVAGGVSAFLGGSPAQLDGAVVVRTPHGERTVPLHARSSR